MLDFVEFLSQIYLNIPMLYLFVHYPNNTREKAYVFRLFNYSIIHLQMLMQVHNKYLVYMYQNILQNYLKLVRFDPVDFLSRQF